MCRLDIVWMVVSPRSAHSFGISMVWDDVVVIGELFVGRVRISLLVVESCDSVICAFRLAIEVHDILSGGADPRPAVRLS